MDCIFCAIADGTIPGKKIYEDDDVLAFLDVNPTAFGHTLVIPKSHTDSMLSADDTVIAKVFQTAAKIGRRMEEVLGCDGVNILSNVHEAAGQSVHHFHVHVIPRYAGEEEAVTIAFSPVEANLDDIASRLAF